MTEPHVYRNGPVGCLLVHGFTGSPNELLELGTFLAEQNLTVSIPTLPGHGTYSADLFNYTWRDWFECVKQAHADLTQTCKEVFVCGMSMGGTLALHLAAHRPLAGVVSLSAPVRFPGWQKLAARYLKGVVKYRKKRGGEDVRDTSAREWLGSYRRYPLYAVDQLFQLVDHVRQDLPEIEQPILVVHSRQDHTIDFGNAQLIFDSVRSQDRQKLELERSYHVVTVDVEKEKVQAAVLAFIRSHARVLKTRRRKKAAAA